jgi:hypothetical protein
LHSSTWRRHSRISSRRFWSMARSVSQAGARLGLSATGRLGEGDAAGDNEILLLSSVLVCAICDSDHALL